MTIKFSYRFIGAAISVSAHARVLSASKTDRSCLLSVNFRYYLVYSGFDFIYDASFTGNAAAFTIRCDSQCTGGDQ